MEFELIKAQLNHLFMSHRGVEDLKDTYSEGKLCPQDESTVCRSRGKSWVKLHVDCYGQEENINMCPSYLYVKISFL